MDLPADPRRKVSAAANASTSKLVIIFWAWKCLLLLLATLSPGPGYDTSTQILLTRHIPSRTDPWSAITLAHVVSRLTRWDAVYFTTSSARGHVNEQEWAFSWVLAKYTSTIARVFPFLQSVSPYVRHGTVGIAVSHLSHFCAVLVLFRLTCEVLSDHPKRRQIAFTAACLHTVSPAGLFLSAHYAESAFALFNFLGMLTYVFAASRPHGSGMSNALAGASWTLVSGICFGQAAVLRSNGLFSGSIFAWDAIWHVTELPDTLTSPARLVRFGATILSGLILAIAFAAPQLVAYLEYCTSGGTRPWCDRLVPSIYTWVQDRYWNVGFLRYWTLSNIPLFVIAAPSVVLLISTAIAALQGQSFQSSEKQGVDKDALAKASTVGAKAEGRLFHHVMPRFALPQVILAILATTSFHAQTISRISSGYPVWYIMLAIAMHDRDALHGKGIMHYLNANAQWIVRAMVMYAVIQGGLFASFLPPA